MRRLMRRRSLLVLLLLLFVPAAGAWTWPVQGPVLQTFSFDPAHPYGARPAPRHRDRRRRRRAGARAGVRRRQLRRHGADERQDAHDPDAVRPRGEPHAPRLDRTSRGMRASTRAPPSAPSARAARPSSTCRTCTSASAKRRTTRAISIRSRSCPCSRRPRPFPRLRRRSDGRLRRRRSSPRRSRSTRPRRLCLRHPSSRCLRRRSCLRGSRRRRACRAGCAGAPPAVEAAAPGRARAVASGSAGCTDVRRRLRPPPRSVRRTRRPWRRSERATAAEAARPPALRAADGSALRPIRLPSGRFACRTCGPARAASLAPRPLPAARPVSTLGTVPPSHGFVRLLPLGLAVVAPRRGLGRARLVAPAAAACARRTAPRCPRRPTAGGSQHDAVLIMEVCASISRLRSTTSTRRRTSATPTRRRWATCSCATTPSVGRRPSSSPASTSTRRRSGGSRRNRGSSRRSTPTASRCPGASSLSG